jgi:16S rRNA pseudouridine516 synthase
MRLDRFLSQASGLSRSQARAAIRGRRVTLDGCPVREPAAQVDESAEVRLDDVRLGLPHSLYLMLHKPRGLLSATRDAHRETVLSLLPHALARRVHLVGRLDKDTSGLLLLVADAEERLASGMHLRGEARVCAPARLQRLDERRVRISVTEGRYHLVRRLFAALGNHVLRLHRERIGGLALDPALPPGHWRTLTPDECEAVFESGADGEAR